MVYAKLMDYFLLLQRAVKANDVDLFSYALFELSSLFFATNHQNYARWMTYYALELCNLKAANPDVYQLLKGGAFSVNRSGKPFSRVPVDMALE